MHAQTTIGKFLKLLLVVLSCVYGTLILTRSHPHDNYFICGMPDFTSGIAALITVLVLFARGILDFRVYGGVGRLVVLICDILMFAVLFSLMKVSKDVSFLASLLEIGKNNLMIVAGIGAVVAVILLGTTNVAKLGLIITVFAMLLSRATLIDAAYGPFGFIALMSMFVSFYVQGTVSMHGLKNEIEILYGSAGKLLDDASTDVKKIGNTIAKVASNQIPGASMTNMFIGKQHNDTNNE